MKEVALHAAPEVAVWSAAKITASSTHHLM